MAELRATPYANPLTGLSNDAIQGLLAFMQDKRRTQQLQGLGNLLESTGIPKTIERAAYAESPRGLLDALTNVNRANVPFLKPETAEAAMTLAPIAAPVNRALMQATKGLPVGASIKNVGQQSLLDVAKRDASDIFGAGAQRIRYTDPKSGGAIDVLSRPDGTASVLGLEVPETFRGQGVGSLLQSKVLQDFPDMQGQVSSKAAATNAYKLGRRPPNMPDATLDDVYKIIDENSSVNMISPQMQQRIAPTPETGLLGQEVTDYRGSHQAPSPDFGAPLYDLTGGGQMYPADVYSPKAAQYYGTGYPKADKEAFAEKSSAAKQDWWWRHDQELEDEFTKVFNFGAELQSKGVNPFDSRDPASQQFRKDLARIETKGKLSKQLQEQYAKDRDVIDKAPTKGIKLVEDRIKENEEFYQTHSLDKVLDEGLLPPSLRYEDPSINLEEIFRGAAGGIAKEGEVNFDQYLTMAPNTLTVPEHKDMVNQQIADMPIEQQEALKIAAQGNGVTPQVYYAAKSIESYRSKLSPKEKVDKILKDWTLEEETIGTGYENTSGVTTSKKQPNYLGLKPCRVRTALLL